jgi:hypothetical protein
MTRLTVHVSEELARDVRQRARTLGTSISRFLRDVVAREVDPHLPPGYFERVVGKWQGVPLQRPLQPAADERGPLR